MRIPGWLIFFASLVLFVSITALCSVVSYTSTRSVVVDMRAAGVDVNVAEAADFLIHGADDTTDGLSPDDIIAGAPTLPASAVPAQQSPTNTPPPGVTFTPGPTVTPSPTLTPDPMTNLTITDPRRITVLLMGIDQRRDMGYETAYRTDTMILAQVDPVRKTIGVLSIPRDLFVTIPGYESARINTANYIGDRDALPGGGPQLAMDTIHANLGVPVDKYVRINFEVFTSVVDTISPSGVEICIPETIHDDHYPDTGTGIIVVHFDPGCQVLDSERLLQYARTRATSGGDFDRNRRQQAVLKAVQSEVLSVGGITHFITRIPRLYEQLAGSYRTNLSLEEILQLAQLVGTIPEENITFRAINNLHVTPANITAADGTPQQVLIPIQNQIRFVVQDAFNPQTDLTLADLRQRADGEDAKIVIVNNTDISGMAASTREWLTSQGVDVFEISSRTPPANHAAIQILDYTGNPWTARYLAALFDLPDEAIGTGTDGLTASDVMILLGTDIEAFLESQGLATSQP
jgi:LCP family protein required for cell wall assembly